jgi:hypothetical protein
MKILKQSLFKVVMITVMVFFLNCKSAQNNVDRSMPLEIGQVYYTNTIDDNQASNLDIYIPIISNPNNIQLLQVFFHGKQTNLVISNDNLIVGHFNLEVPKKSDIIMSSDPYAEYGNQVPKLQKPTPFILKDNECVISYKDGGVVKYFKIDNIIKK